MTLPVDILALLTGSPYIFNIFLANTVGILLANLLSPCIVSGEKDIPVLVRKNNKNEILCSSLSTVY